MENFYFRNIKKQIEDFAFCAQAMRQDIRWVFSDAFLFEFAGRVAPKPVVIVRFVNGFCNNGIVFWLVFIWSIPLVLISVIVLKLRFDWSQPESHREPAPAGRDVFVGFGAAAERPLLSWYQAMRGRDPLYVKSARALKQYIHLTTYDVLKVSLSKFYTGHATLRNLPPGLRPLRLKLQWSLIKHVGLYSYWYCGFTRLKQLSKPSEVLFIHSGLSAFAAVDAGLNVKFVSHGLLRHSIVFPDFSEVQVMTDVEAVHVQTRCPHFKRVRRQDFRKEPQIKISKRRRVLLLAAHGSWEEIKKYNEFLEALPFDGFEVGFRPRKNNLQCSIKSSDFKMTVQVLSDEGSFSDLIAEYNPALVVSTVSAGLIEANDTGCDVVCLGSERDRVIIDMVYPMLDNFLTWPRQHRQVKAMLQDIQ